MTSIYLLQEYIRPQETGCKPANMPHVTDAAWEKKTQQKFFGDTTSRCWFQSNCQNLRIEPWQSALKRKQ